MLLDENDTLFVEEKNRVTGAVPGVKLWLVLTANGASPHGHHK
jgi:hypothetical protein